MAKVLQNALNAMVLEELAVVLLVLLISATTVMAQERSSAECAMEKDTFRQNRFWPKAFFKPTARKAVGYRFLS